MTLSAYWIGGYDIGGIIVFARGQRSAKKFGFNRGPFEDLAWIDVRSMKMPDQDYARQFCAREEPHEAEDWPDCTSCEMNYSTGPDELCNQCRQVNQ